MKFNKKDLETYEDYKYKHNVYNKLNILLNQNNEFKILYDYLFEKRPLEIFNKLSLIGKGSLNYDKYIEELNSLSEVKRIIKKIITNYSESPSVRFPIGNK